MNIVYTFNDKFVPQVAAGICSICENNQDEKITFYLIADGLSLENHQKLKDFVKSYHQDIKIIEIGDIRKYFDFDFDASGWSPVVVTRLLLDKFLPNAVNRVLYLDGDTIVRGNLSNLYYTDMGESVIGAGAEPTINRVRKDTLVGPKSLYYNSGVLLINMKKWRKEHTGKKILDFYRAHDGRLFAPDQDAINGALAGEIYTLSPKYNFFNIYTQYPYKFLKKLVAPAKYFSEQEYRDSVKNPIIVHYLGEERPWRAGSTHKYKDDYKKYFEKTPWHDVPDEEGWRIYFVCWNIFNAITKPFPALRYKVITSLIPLFIKLRAKQNRRTENLIRKEEDER